jgi:hypothetical protein
MNKINLNVAKDFSEYPGGRSRKTSDHSGEELYQDFLQPKFNEAVSENKILCINLDGAAGYAASFLDEAFGRLGLEFGLEECKKRLEIISTEEPYLVDEVFQSIEEWSVDGIHYNSSLAEGVELKENNYFTRVKKKNKQ